MLRTILISLPFQLWSAVEAGAAAGDTAHRAAEDDLRQALQGCRGEPEAVPRLACFDRLARDNAPPDYAGKLGFRTRIFAIDKPTRLRYRSQGVIFVLYVFDERGEVLQNLHVGGGGEGDYLIRSPGNYSLQIDGSASWQIWLDPLEGSASEEETSP